MAVREFIDGSGATWRVWCITPEAIHPVTRAEDYLADCYQLGWLVFETTTGDRKRRLCPFPKDWDELDDRTLGELLGRAEIVPRRKLARDHEDVADQPSAPATPAQPDLTDLAVVRSFRYPGGRLWSVAVVPHSDIAPGPVLRFTAGARNIDLVNWPEDWPDLPDEQLVDLLRHGAPRDVVRYGPEIPRRRYNDPRA